MATTQEELLLNWRPSLEKTSDTNPIYNLTEAYQSINGIVDVVKISGDSTLTHFPSFFMQFTHLKSLFIEHTGLCSFENLPASLPAFSYSHNPSNSLTSFLDFFKNVPKLKHLEIQNNQISSFAGFSSNSSLLYSIDASKNCIVDLIGFPTTLPKLECL